MIAAAGHDIVHENGRYVEEAQSGALTAAYMDAVGGFSAQRQENVYNAVLATTFDEKTRKQMILADDPRGTAVASRATQGSRDRAART